MGFDSFLKEYWNIKLKNLNDMLDMNLKSLIGGSRL